MVLTPRGEALRAPGRCAGTSVICVRAYSVRSIAGSGQVSCYGTGLSDAIDYASGLSKGVKSAPNMQIELENLSARGINDMCEGRISLGFGVADDGPQLDNVAAQALLKDRQVCLMRKRILYIRRA